MTTRDYPCFICLLLLLSYAAPSFAEIIFYVAPEGEKSFAIEADDISEKASIEVTVLYNPEILASPRVRLETGTLADVWDFIPGTLVFRADQGDDPGPSFLAHLSFTRAGDAPGGILSVKGKISEPDGTVTQSNTMPNLPIVPGSSLFDANSSFGDREPAPEAGAAETAESPDAWRLLTEKSEQNVLQRFLEYRGGRQLDAFVSLFQRTPSATLIQEPPIVLSDGKTPVQIRVAPETPEGGAPNVALSDAKLVGLRYEGEKGWVITALPNEGTWNASLIVQTGEKVVSSSLVVAPPVGIRPGISRGNFLAELDRFISSRTRGGKGEVDPLRRHLYEYIFTANFLAVSGNPPAKGAPEQSSIASNSN